MQDSTPVFPQQASELFRNILLSNCLHHFRMVKMRLNGLNRREKMIALEEVERMIQAGIPDATVVVNDMTGTGDHLEARVMSKSFVGKSLVQQHQMVYGALGDAMAGPIHALKLTTIATED
jgi:stress-induced morphogen